MLRPLVLVAGLFLIQASAIAQQVGDEDFRFTNTPPAFAVGEGPRVCVDEAHNNFHTADGRYAPFARLLRDDGFVVVGSGAAFSADALADCDVLVVANALADENVGAWEYPHGSAITTGELRAVAQWVRSGGRLLVFADHAPFAAGAAGLGAVMGVVMADVYASNGSGFDTFRRSDGTLREHPIFDGRTEGERVDSVTTFTGQAFQVTEGWQPLIVFGPRATASIHASQIFGEGPPNTWPSFGIPGWVHAAARVWDDGRVVVMGEAATCTAQLVGPERFPIGMNNAQAGQNAQFCLNMVRWLAM